MTTREKNNRKAKNNGLKNRLKATLVIVAIGLVLVFDSSLWNVHYTYATTAPKENIKVKNQSVVIAKDIGIKIYGNEKIFKNFEGKRIYPISYSNITYIPARIIAEIAGENIEWAEETKSIFIGKTLYNPNKSLVKNDIPEGLVSNFNPEKDSRGEPIIATGVLDYEVIVLKDFDYEELNDQKGQPLPVVFYHGISYLPVRFLADVLKQTVEWNDETKTISIGSENFAGRKELGPKIKNCKLELQKTIEVYDTANTLITEMSKDISEEEKMECLVRISKALVFLNSRLEDVDSWDLDDYTAQEKCCYEKICKATETSKSYVAVLENIAYLKVQKQDFSMLSEPLTLMYVNSQKAIDEARNLIESMEVPEGESKESKDTGKKHKEKKN